MKSEPDLGRVLEEWMLEDTSMPDDLDEVLRAVGVTPQHRSRWLSVLSWPWRREVLFNATKAASVVAAVTLSVFLLALGGPWDRADMPQPAAVNDEAMAVDAQMLAVHDPTMTEAEFEAAVAATYAADAFVRDVWPDSVDEARGLAEIGAGIGRDGSWQRTGQLRVLAPVADELRYLGIYEVSKPDYADGLASSVVCVVSANAGLVETRECSHGAGAPEAAPSADAAAIIETADDRFLEALNEDSFPEVRGLVEAAFAPEAIYRKIWSGGDLEGGDTLDGAGMIAGQFTDPMSAVRLESPMPLPAEPGASRYVAIYDYTYERGAGQVGYWPGSVCAAWLHDDLITRMDCFFPKDSYLEADD